MPDNDDAKSESAITEAHEKGFEAGYAQACEDFGRTSAAIAADALREAAAALGTGPTMRVLVERESCDWWTERPVARWLHERAHTLSTPPAAESDDDDEDCGCRVSHPRWCAWNGPCCDRCSHGAEEAHAECCGSATSPGGGGS